MMMVKYAILRDYEEFGENREKRLVSALQQLNHLSSCYDICSTNLSQVFANGKIITSILVGYME